MLKKILINIFTESGTCTPTYQLSPDGTNFYYWNGSNWVSATLASESSSSSVISTNIASFTAQVSTGNLVWKAFMNSDSTASCQIDNIAVELN